jgi:hypothetical protein
LKDNAIDRRRSQEMESALDATPRDRVWGDVTMLFASPLVCNVLTSSAINTLTQMTQNSQELTSVRKERKKERGQKVFFLISSFLSFFHSSIDPSFVMITL